MNKRPKSREETPKEGSDSASATAPQQYATALHKAQGLSSYFQCKVKPQCGFATGLVILIFSDAISIAWSLLRGPMARIDGPFFVYSRFRDRPCHSKIHPNREADSAFTIP